MNVLAAGLSWIDLEFLGRPHAIASGIVHAPGGVAIVDPGPTTCRATLERGLARLGLGLGDVRHILLTHIHLDHAGATGSIVRDYPAITVAVHERGAPHLVAPQKLLESATRLYGGQMERLWGEVLPVPESNLLVLHGGEQVEAGGRRFEVAYTPGHASHHVCYFDPGSGVVFAGDTAGVCVDGGYVIPPTPPPDIDLEAWRASVARLEAWAPATLFLTHFGPAPSVRPHLQTLLHNLTVIADLVKESLTEPGSDEERWHRFSARFAAELRRHVTEAQLSAYEAATPFELLWLGLARYWRKKARAV